MIYVTGDTHGELADFQQKEFKKLKRGDYLLVCGDFGFFWNGDKSEQKALKWLSRQKYTILFVEGTHDNLDIIEAVTPQDWNGGQVRKLGENLFQLCRGHIFRLEGNYIFAMGGGESPDMDQREAQGAWWERELPNAQEMEQARERLAQYRNVVDYIITHDCPATLQKNFSKDEMSLHANPLNLFFDEISRECRFKQWYFGCYHADKRIPPYHTAVFRQLIALR